jgi:3-oxoacyl-[acyl-carrier-protein] synthase I
MISQPLAIFNSGLVTSVGLTAAASCAAIRAGLSSPTETNFLDSAGEWIVAHQVMLDRVWRGRKKLVKMAALAIDECLAGIPRSDWPRIPLILCIAERERPGRLEGLDDQLFSEILAELNVEFANQSLIVPGGRVSLGAALLHASELISKNSVSSVLIVATDSLLASLTLNYYESRERLLTARNSNGFMPGEGAGALLVGRPDANRNSICTGLGFATEPVNIDSTEPLAGSGLARAIKAALANALCEIGEIDFRVTDISGEQYYFKEATLALSRMLRVRKEEFDVWHPSECTGELGAAAALATVVVADFACRKGYARGPNILCHAGNDAGQRIAIIIQFKSHRGIP